MVGLSLTAVFHCHVLSGLALRYPVTYVSTAPESGQNRHWSKKVFLIKVSCMQDHMSTLFLADNGYKAGFVNNFFLASKGEIERKFDQRNVIINQLVEQVNALTPVSGIQCYLSCVTCLQYSAHAMTQSVTVVDAVKLVYAQGFNGTNGINGNDGMQIWARIWHLLQRPYISASSTSDSWWMWSPATVA